MRAIEFERYGPTDVLHVASVDRPRPAPGEVLVRVEASTVNPIDTIIRSGKLKFRTGKVFPKRIGIDFSGRITDVGAKAEGFALGDRVWGVMPLNVEKGVGQGSAADYVTITPDRLAIQPANVDPIEAAAASSVGGVALITLEDRAALKPGERILIRGAAGGVGCMAVQLAKSLGAHVTVLASARDLDFLTTLGADEAHDYRSVDASDLEPFDVILDLVGTQLRRYRRLLTSRGRMFCLAITGLSAILYIFISKVHGSKRVRFFSAAPMADTMRKLTSLVESGTLRPIVHGVHSILDIAEAHRSIEAGGGRGKRVIAHVGSET